MSIAVAHHRFSVADYQQIIELGILTENDRVELIRGEILEKMSIGELHASVVMRLNRLFQDLFSTRAIVAVQSPVVLADSEPEPDVTLLAPKDDFYASGKPSSADVLLVVEVSDTTLEFDRTVKRDLYAENGLEEYWIVNLIAGEIEVHRTPQRSGMFSDIRFLSVDSVIELKCLPGTCVPVADVLGPRSA
jgi:Uma2 family endonuclease